MTNGKRGFFCMIGMSTSVKGSSSMAFAGISGECNRGESVWITGCAIDKLWKKPYNETKAGHMRFSEGRGCGMKVIVGLWMAILLASAWPASAEANSFHEEDVPVDKEWTVVFNKEVSEEGLSIIMGNGPDEWVPEWTVSGKEVYVHPPEEGYAYSQSYWMDIRSATSVSGQTLSYGAYLSFQTEHRVLDVEAAELYPEEMELAALINAYRIERGLEPFEVSRSLTKVARAHVNDSNAHRPERGQDARGVDCNLHSWSDQGDWTPVCYTSDHEYAEKMWNKPAEITGGLYQGSGFEISTWRSSGMTAEGALTSWQGSPPHHNVIIGDGWWSNLTVMGVAVSGEYSHVWFGTENDPAGYYELD